LFVLFLLVRNVDLPLSDSWWSDVPSPRIWSPKPPTPDARPRAAECRRCGDNWVAPVCHWSTRWDSQPAWSNPMSSSHL